MGSRLTRAAVTKPSGVGCGNLNAFGESVAAPVFHPPITALAEFVSSLAKNQDVRCERAKEVPTCQNLQPKQNPGPKSDRAVLLLGYIV